MTLSLGLGHGHIWIYGTAVHITRYHALILEMPALSNMLF